MAAAARFVGRLCRLHQKPPALRSRRRRDVMMCVRARPAITRGQPRPPLNRPLPCTRHSAGGADRPLDEGMPARAGMRSGAACEGSNSPTLAILASLRAGGRSRTHTLLILIPPWSARTHTGSGGTQRSAAWRGVARRERAERCLSRSQVHRRLDASPARLGLALTTPDPTKPTPHPTQP